MIAPRWPNRPAILARKPRILRPASPGFPTRLSHPIVICSCQRRVRSSHRPFADEAANGQAATTPKGPRMAKSIALAADASRLASLLLSYIPAVCAFVAPRPPGASPAIIDRHSHPRALRRPVEITWPSTGLLSPCTEDPRPHVSDFREKNPVRRGTTEELPKMARR